MGILRKKRFFRRQNPHLYRPPAVYNSLGKNKSGEMHLSFGQIKAVFQLFIFIGAVYLVFFSKYFAISDVIVEGNHFIPTEKILSHAPLGENIFLFDLFESKEKITKNIPEVKDIEIYRGIPNAIKIIVLERDGKMIWQSGDYLYLISSAGEVARRYDDLIQVDQTLPKVVDKKNIPVQVGDLTVSPHFVSFVNIAYNHFFELTNIKPTYFEVDETTFDIVIFTEAGFYVKLNTMRSAKKQLSNLKDVLVEKHDDIHEYVDLRIDGWAYYK